MENSTLVSCIDGAVTRAYLEHKWRVLNGLAERSTASY